MLLAIFKDILHDVVLHKKSVACTCLRKLPTHPKLILHEVDNVLMKLIHERSSLFLAQVFETSLENTTSISVG
jgi:hypothetical protein